MTPCRAFRAPNTARTPVNRRHGGADPDPVDRIAGPGPRREVPRGTRNVHTARNAARSARGPGGADTGMARTRWPNEVAVLANPAGRQWGPGTRGTGSSRPRTAGLPPSRVPVGCGGNGDTFACECQTCRRTHLTRARYHGGAPASVRLLLVGAGRRSGHSACPRVGLTSPDWEG